jgi:hypothetical protein
MTANLTPVETRAQDVVFVTQCSFHTLQDRLPFAWPAPPDISPSPKKRYRSHYLYQGWEDLRAPAAWEHLSDFDLTLRIVDFDPLRPMLAQLLGWTSAQGQVPFDPVSIFLLIGWQITNGWNRTETLRNIRHPRYADCATHFGFEDGVFPTEGGLRYWLTTIGKNSTSDETVLVDEERQIEVAMQHLNRLLAQSVLLFVESGLLTAQAWNEALVCPDGMIHDAASRMRCAFTQETCYQSGDTPRACPAKAKGRDGCDCDANICHPICRYATPRDPDARFVWYSGSNKRRGNPNRSTDPIRAKKKHGKGRFGYRSLPLQLADPARRFSIVLLDDFLPATAYEEDIAAALLHQLPTFYPDLSVDTVAGDAAFGHDNILRIVYRHLQARRAIDLRCHETDKNKSLWPIRGYDDKGRPVCPFGYTFTANGFDSGRQRHKWFCGQACRNGRTPVVCVENVSYPPDECPYLGVDHPHGRIVNVGEAFDDKSVRLVRDFPVGSQSWKRFYHRARNAVEGRNACLEAWGLKRLPVYGTPRGKALIFQADVWLNLTTLARLIREATSASGHT